MRALLRLEPEPLTDAQVVAQIGRGDTDAYRLLVQRYQDTLYRHAMSMVRDGDTAADLVQATFVHAYAQLDTLRDTSSFGGWVYRMCTNRCRDHLKSVRRRDVGLDDAPAAALSATSTASDRVERDDLRRTLDAALDSLPDEHREAFVMKHVEERSYDEMADVLGASVSALKMRVHRAREALRHALQEVV